MKYYCINRYDHATNINETIMVFTDKREVLDNIEDYLLQYVQKQDGSQRIPDMATLHKIMFKEVNMQNALLPGHYISRSDQFNTYTIYRYLKAEESVPGKIWGAYKVEKSKLRKVQTLSVSELNFELIKQSQKAQIYNNIPSLSELKRVWGSESEDEEVVTESEKKYSQVIDTLIDSKTMRKIRHMSDQLKGYKLSELRHNNIEFMKCPLATVFEPKQKELPKYENMVNELNIAVSERNKNKETVKEIVK